MPIRNRKFASRSEAIDTYRTGRACDLDGLALPAGVLAGEVDVGGSEEVVEGWAADGEGDGDVGGEEGEGAAGCGRC